MRLFGDFEPKRVGLAMLVLRVVSGVALVMHGLPKIAHPFNWMDKPGKPSPIPDALQALAALGEFGGGLGLIFGFLTPIAALGVIATMLGAKFTAHAGDPWINPGGRSFELASVYFLIALTILLAGPGAWSLDAKLFGKGRGSRK
jgi:putative oxidoreductase